MKALAVITARAGSKGIPGKNLADLAGRPMLSYTLEAALQCGEFDRVVVSTDGQEIGDLARDYGADVVWRPPELAGDRVRSQPVVRHVLDTLGGEIAGFRFLAGLQPTSPLRGAEHIREAFRLYRESGMRGSLISVVEPDKHPMKCFLLERERLRPWIDTETLGAPRQQLPCLYNLNGAIGITTITGFLESGDFYTEPLIPYFMSRASSVDIDAPEDLELAAYYLKRGAC
ncbi:MAG: acylneuraminate cytidylyltransferase family protein [Candidatus Sedimenticola endophacoides]